MLRGYMGDIDLCHGGYFWNLDDASDELARIVQVTPASDMGGPDNLFFVETGELWLGDAKRMADALECAGARPIVDGVEPEPWERIAAMMSYAGMDISSRETLQIGANDRFFDYRGGSGFDMPRRDEITYLGRNTDLRAYLINFFGLES